VELEVANVFFLLVVVLFRYCPVHCHVFSVISLGLVRMYSILGPFIYESYGKP